MDSAKSFASPLALVERARDHISDFSAEIAPFMRGGKEPFVEDDGGDTLLKIRFAEKIPDKAAVIAADAVANLRSALDHAVFASVVALTGQEPKGTKFPFGDTPEQLAGELKRAAFRLVHPKVIDAIRALEPHEAGNFTLWILNKLRNTRTHRLLLHPAGRNQSIGFGNGRFNVQFKWMGSEWDADSSTLTVARMAPGHQIDGDLNLRFFVSLPDAGKLSGIAAAEALGKMADAVDAAVRAIIGGTEEAGAASEN